MPSTAISTDNKRAAPAKPARVRPVPALSRCIAILRLLGRSEDPLGVHAIARELGLVPSTCLHILRVLTEEQLLAFDPVNKKYQVAAGLAVLARSALRSHTFAAVVQPELEQLAARYGATAIGVEASGLEHMVVVALAWIGVAATVVSVLRDGAAGAAASATANPRIAPVWRLLTLGAGLGSLLATSFWTFTIIKWLGIIYLVYLGARSLFFPSNSLIAADGPSVSGRSSFVTALTVQLANPKLLLFLAALLPQFLDPSRPIALQLAILGPIFMLSDTVIYLLLSMLAARARPLLGSPRATRIVSRVSGLAMLGAAARVAAK